MQADDSGPVNNGLSPKHSQSVWPVETDLVFVPGSRKVMLMSQRPLIRMVIQDVIEQVRCALIFDNTFPDTFVVLDFTQGSLLVAAESNERATIIHNRLLSDAEYMNKMAQLVSYLIQIMILLTFFQPRAHILLIQAEVKDYCVATVQNEFLPIGSELTQFVDWQLLNYHYIYPVLNISVSFLQNTV